jgi:hypothetical protein
MITASGCSTSVISRQQHEHLSHADTTCLIRRVALSADVGASKKVETGPATLRRKAPTCNRSTAHATRRSGPGLSGRHVQAAYPYRSGLNLAAPNDSAA